MGISNGVVILLCILGAGAALMCGYAIGTRLWNGSPDDGPQDIERVAGNDFNQAAYMREVRLRNQDKIFSLARGSQQRAPAPAYDQPTPVTYSNISGSSY